MLNKNYYHYFINKSTWIFDFYLILQFEFFIEFRIELLLIIFHKLVNLNKIDL